MKPCLLELPDGANPVVFGGKVISSLVSQYGAARFVRFFFSRISSEKDRQEQACAIAQFCHWAGHCGHNLEELGPITISIYLERLNLRLAMSAVRVHAQAIRVLFDWFVSLGLLEENPAPSQGEVDQLKTHGLPAANAAWADRNVIDVVAFH